MPVDTLMYNYFRNENSVFRRYVESVAPGELLSSNEIVERTGLRRPQVWGLMNRLLKRGLVERVPFVWPDPPEGFELWGQNSKIKWRRRVSGQRYGRPPIKYLFLGFNVIPVDELLRLANLDLTSLISLEAV